MIAGGETIPDELERRGVGILVWMEASDIDYILRNSWSGKEEGAGHPRRMPEVAGTSPGGEREAPKGRRPSLFTRRAVRATESRGAGLKTPGERDRQPSYLTPMIIKFSKSFFREMMLEKPTSLSQRR